MNSLVKLPPFQIGLLLAAILLPASCFAAIDPTPELPDPTVQISDQDGALQVNISFRVPVSPREAWAVLTDFEHMSGFIPNLESSQVLMKSEKTIQVEQKGSINLGMFPIHYESKRQVDLTPYQMIRSRSLSGNTRLDSVMVLTPIGMDTLLSYRATAVPDLPVPNSLVTSYMGEMLENQFKAMGQEMVRRSHLVNSNIADTGKQPVPQTKSTLKKVRAQTKKRPD